jgi:hypothetical protein
MYLGAPHGHKNSKMVIKYTKNFQFMGLLQETFIGIFGMQKYHLATQVRKSFGVNGFNGNS